MSSDSVPEILVAIASRIRPEWSERDHREYMRWLLQFDQVALAKFNPMMMRCESPIERMFLSALLLESVHNAADVTADGYRIYDGRGDIASDLYVQVQPRLAIDGKSMRPDFGLGLRFFEKADAIHWLYVECDGHDYHSSKSDLARDKGRDRLIASTDHHVIRFTGSEIWANASACAEEAVSIIHRIAAGRAAA